VIHRQRGDPVARFQAAPLECLRQTPGIMRNARPVRPRFAPVRPAGDNLPVAMFARRMIEQARHAQFEILHSTEHLSLLPLAGANAPMRMFVGAA
jgi:hypothetical protein